MNGTIVVYIVYLVLAVALICWLGFTFYRYGRVFLGDIFAHQPSMADAISRLLVSGFVVFTLGYALLLLRIDSSASVLTALRWAVHRFGLLLLSLGILHVLNMLILSQLRRRVAARAQQQSRRDRRRAIEG